MEHKEHEHKLQRELRQGKAYVTPLTVDGDPIVWLKQRAKVGDILLLHQEDGVVWGKSHRDGDWVTSNDIAGYEHSPRLCVDRLWDARLFNERREILLWRDDKGAWQAREIADEDGGGALEFTEWFDEPQLLWGNYGRTALIHGIAFSMLEEGAEGLHHAPPIALGLSQEGNQLEASTRACLKVRHYLAKDEDAARVAASRLVALDIHQEEKR